MHFFQIKQNKERWRLHEAAAETEELRNRFGPFSRGLFKGLTAIRNVPRIRNNCFL